MKNVKQYEIYQFDLSQCIVDEEIPEKVLEGAILSPNVMNDVLKTVIMAPLCPSCNPTPTTLQIGDGLFIRLDQISSINKKRIVKKTGVVDKSKIPRVKEVLDEMLIK